MLFCKKCDRRHHVIQSIRTDKKNKKKYVVTICSYCKHEIDVEEYKK